jgi:hypothetical protein
MADASKMVECDHLVFVGGDPIPLAKLADTLGAVADELRCEYYLDDFAARIDAIAEDVKRRELLSERKAVLERTWPKNPDGTYRARSASNLMKHLRRDRRYQQDMRLILKAGGTTYRGKEIKGGDDPYIVLFNHREMLAEFRADWEKRLGYGPSVAELVKELRSGDDSSESSQTCGQIEPESTDGES